MNAIPHLDADEAMKRLQRRANLPYFAMYSSVLGGIVTDQSLMVVPVDDHGVHRGDGVFESLKFIDGGIYNLEGHLRRIEHSAAQIRLHPIPSREELGKIVCATARAAERTGGQIRILLTRGPGSLGVNPYDCPRPACYVIIHSLPESLMERKPDGARAASSDIPVKPDWYPRVKSCNYLPNAMMKMESVDRGVDFCVSFDEVGNLAEGPTENIGVVDAAGRLVVPEPHAILAGTTMERVLELARPDIDCVREALPKQTLQEAREMLVFGTTTDVTSITSYDDRPVGDGKPGPVYRLLRQRLVEDIRENSAFRTVLG